MEVSQVSDSTLLGCQLNLKYCKTLLPSPPKVMGGYVFSGVGM